MKISILIPTYNRLNALTATLTALLSQTCKDFELIISDQSDLAVAEDGTIQTIKRVFELHKNPVRILQNLPSRGIAHQRQFLLEQATGEYSLFLDDDIILEADVLERMLTALEDENAGFVGMPLIGLSYLNDYRPHQQYINFWENKVEPEIVRPGTEEWNRYPLHNAANILHVAEKLAIYPANQKKYKVSWVGGCVLFNTAKLKETGGFDFWEELPENHCGEDVLAQLRLMERYGGFGLIPSGAYHLELPTTIVHREVNAPEYFYKTNSSESFAQ
ncbi:glycosyltransferase family 2 protein [Rubrolithibacter danxiaensis]|uniref:glycosyltransferase family 2 protein n=1 Tax=Rubrolithibacter danxiaensis TaxID=3390805 RepID=UPI003BF783EC